jgi:hypothetical protein
VKSLGREQPRTVGRRSSKSSSRLVTVLLHYKSTRHNIQKSRIVTVLLQNQVQLQNTHRRKFNTVSLNKWCHWSNRQPSMDAHACRPGMHTPVPDTHPNTGDGQEEKSTVVHAGALLCVSSRRWRRVRLPRPWRNKHHVKCTTWKSAAYIEMNLEFQLLRIPACTGWTCRAGFFISAALCLNGLGPFVSQLYWFVTTLLLFCTTVWIRSIFFLTEESD